MSNPLSPLHYEMLRQGSAISDEVIKARGYCSMDDPEEVQGLGFNKAQARTAPVLAIPLWDVHGHQSGWQIRPDSPRQGDNGKIFKYENPKGGKVQLDVHPSVQSRLGDPHETLWITEGVRKGDALVSQGECAIALTGGVWGFKGPNPNGGKMILHDWEYVALNGREVYVAYDSDVTAKPEVKAAMKALWELLRHKGAKPASVHWPEEYTQQKWGVDDFLADHKTIEDLKAMIPPIGLLPEKAPHGGLYLKSTKEGRPRPVLCNVLDVFEHDPRWSGVLGYNELLNSTTLLQRPPYQAETGPWTARPIEECDYSETANWLQHTFDLCSGTALVAEGLETMAHRSPFHPIRTYLDSLTWDGTPRLDTWLVRYGHAEDTAYVHAVGSKTLLGAVARVEEPGCKVDTVPILEGGQGLFKSTLWRVMASDPWFTDSLPDLHDKDAAQSLRGKWFVELGELAALQRSELEAIKRFISANQDHYRPSYGRRAMTYPRQNIFVGSTNKDTYLKDETGNRRFWPVALTGLCDIAALERDRDQLWAEALVRYRQEEQWYLTPELEELAIEQQAQRLEPDDWEEPIMAHVTDLNFVTSKEIMQEVFKFENPAQWTQANTKRIGAILRRNNWKSANRRPLGQQVRGFAPPTATGATGSTAAKSDTRSSETPYKNNVVTGATGATGPYTHVVEKNGENGENGKYTFLSSSLEVYETPVAPVAPVAPAPSLPPCPACHGHARWDDYGTLRCVVCWPQEVHP